MPLIYAVVLGIDHEDATLTCIESLLKSTYEAMKVLYVDNSSKGEAVKNVRERFSSLEIIENNENLGYAGGNNVGIKHALDAGAEYILIVNNDVVVDGDTVSTLFELMHSDGKIGIAGAKALRADDPSRLCWAWGKLNYRNMVSEVIGLDAPDSDEFSKVQDVDYVFGCAVMVKVEAIRKVGMIDEDFWAFHEEMEWCERFRKDGYRVVFAGNTKVLHQMSLSFSSLARPHVREYLLARNSVLFMKKHGTFVQWLKFLLFMTLSTLLKGPLDVIKGQGWRQSARIKGYIEGLAWKSGGPKKLKEYLYSLGGPP